MLMYFKTHQCAMSLVELCAPTLPLKVFIQILPIKHSSAVLNISKIANLREFFDVPSIERCFLSPLLNLQFEMCCFHQFGFLSNSDMLN